MANLASMWEGSFYLVIHEYSLHGIWVPLYIHCLYSDTVLFILISWGAHCGIIAVNSSCHQWPVYCHVSDCGQNVFSPHEF